MTSSPRSVFDVYIPLIRTGKLFGILPHNFQLPCKTAWAVDGGNRCGSLLTGIISVPFRVLTLGVFFFYVAFLGLVKFYHIFGLTLVNDTLKAVTWSILSITSIAIFAFFRRNASEIEDIIRALHEMEQNLFQGNSCRVK